MDEPPGNIEFLNILTGPELVSMFLYSAGLLVLLILAIMITLSKTALLSLTTDDMLTLRLQPGRRAYAALILLERPELFITTVTWVNTAVWLTLIVFLGKYMTAALWVIPVVALVAFTSEMLLKVYAVKHNMRLSMRAAPTWLVLTRLCKPGTWPLRRFRSWMQRLLQQESKEPTAEELAEVLGLSLKGDNAEEDNEKEILRGALTFTRLSVRQVMIPIKNASAVSSRLTFTQLQDHIARVRFARLPVYAESADKIVGILYVKDLLPFIHEPGDFGWQNLIRPPTFVRESKKIDLLLIELLEKAIKMAIVTNTAGRTVGLVTLHDLSEEIVGDINNEFDHAVAFYRRVDDHTCLFAGDVSMTDLYKMLLPDTEPFPAVEPANKSLHEQLLEWHGKMPVSGDVISHEQFTFTVESLEYKEIKQVRVYIHERQKH
ncbi:CNNM domain-containing protein [Parachryseolinea silvisoli]|uniref:CNNM domain-containing protein n=1 Tax=Parachryseolinea silvisoli TaxID=2873601 RepID=UPI002265A29B|nr:CNNM domain-containing protein [Parachryseolinea silvisoli]MCD9016252.1 CNNM domain-containing protein [Parachryseolinea silvisoli]